MVDKKECDIIECSPSTNGQKIFIEVEYTVNGQKRKRGWGFSLDAFDKGRFMRIIDLKIKEERDNPEVPQSIINKAIAIKGHKIDLLNKKIIHKDTGEEII